MAMLDASRAASDARSVERRPVPKACGGNDRRVSSDARARSAAALALTPPRLRPFRPHRGPRDLFSSLLQLAHRHEARLTTLDGALQRAAKNEGLAFEAE